MHSSPSAGTAELVHLSEELDFTPSCEHSNHKGDTRRHEGPAAWYQAGDCPDCGASLNALVCDRWRQRVSEWARTTYMAATCPECHEAFIVSEAKLTYTKI